MKDPKNTLRYKHMVAALKDRPPYVKEAALLKEIAKGRQWRMDAVLDAIAAKPGDWSYINQTQVMKQAAMFGRLQTVKNISATLGYDKESRHGGEPVIAAFHVASLHGRYRTASYLHQLGAGPDFLTTRNDTPRASLWAAQEGDMRKMNFLISKGHEPSLSLNMAVTNGDVKMVDHLLQKGADVNYAAEGFWTPFLMAVKYRNFAMAEHLLQKGADPSISGGETLLNVIEACETTLLEKLLARGVKADADLVQRAIYAGKLDAAEIMLKAGVDVNERGGAVLITALNCKNADAAVDLCLRYGAKPETAYATITRPKQSWERGQNDDKITAALAALIEKDKTPNAPKNDGYKNDGPRPPSL